MKNHMCRMVHSPRSMVHSLGMAVGGLWSVTIRLCVLMMMLSIHVSAQYSGYAQVKDRDSFKKQFTLESSKIMSITSNFIQEKILTALTEKITSTGTFKFKRSDKIRIDYVKPFVYLMVMNADKMLVRDDRKENRINVRSNKMFRQINRIIIDCVQGSILDSKDFKTRVFENEKSYLLEMTPVDKSLADFFKNIILIVDKKDYSARSIEMNEPSGDKTMITFTDKKLNVPVPDEVFAI